MSFSAIKRRKDYYRRILVSYLTLKKSALTFWHETPAIDEDFVPGKFGVYPMSFAKKADYAAFLDPSGIPLMNYHGVLGLQYNPIAIAQYGLGNYNLFQKTGSTDRRRKFLLVADWLVSRLEKNRAGLWVWHHHFDWEYRTLLKAPWYSGLAQGQGISVLIRAWRETGETVYREAASKAFGSFFKTVEEGGVVFRDKSGGTWLEEYIVDPPTHILNGFIWALWGLQDYFLATGEEPAKRLFEEGVRTLVANLPDYDCGFWSLYEQSGTRFKMLASSFYHQLHIVQLKILYRMTGEAVLDRFTARWESYRASALKRAYAFLRKVVFKLCYY